jgi:hypothetical protein
MKLILVIDDDQAVRQIAAKELGGKLTAQREGPRTGAKFVLEPPLQPPANL